MRSELRTLLAVALTALALALWPEPASAGITTDLKTGRPSDVHPSPFSQLVSLQNVAFPAAIGSSSAGGDASSEEGRSGRRRPGDPRDPVMLLPSHEYQQIAQGLITPEEAAAGCGGAQVAGGDAGWGALALVGLFLALRRRK